MSNYKKQNWYKRKAPGPPRNPPSEISSYNTEPVEGYHGFKLYFPNPDSVDIKQIIGHVKCFENFIERNRASFLYPTIREQKAFTVDYKFIIAEEIVNEWVDLISELINNTEYCLNCMGLAVYETLLLENTPAVGETTENPPLIRARLINYEPILQLKDLKIQHYGKLVSARGTVIRARPNHLAVQYMVFSCRQCSGTQIVEQIDSSFTLPSKCMSSGCRASSNFIPLDTSPFIKCVPSQSIKIQEVVGNDLRGDGGMPRTLECELTADLVNSCIPGDDITITGVIKALKPTDNTPQNKQSTTFYLYLSAVSVVNNKNENEGCYSASKRITFTVKDYYAIQKIHAEPHLFRFLVHSLCPSIYGHEIVKAGMLLALFGGKQDKSTRGESHVLLVGDPGLGKSQMLQACTNVAPRGVYVCGNTSTSSGLTVTMTREAGEVSLEAGALMLADQGICCIDEFDKMPTQHACLLEAMEQQRISIAKAGMVCSLPTRCTILAAANPAGGYYVKGKTIAENLKISSPMLSRFDLIFILLDQPNHQLDMMLSEHVLSLHFRTVSGSPSSSNPTLATNASQMVTLKDRIKIQPGEKIDYLPHSLFRKFIAYAQKYVNPELSAEAKVVLKEFFLQLRKQFQHGQSTPVTTRQLSSLIRLTQARAKLELREVATRDDALDVVEIMKHSLVDIFTDDFGVINTSRSQNGTGMSSKNLGVRFLKLLQQKSDAEAKSIFTLSELKAIAERAGIDKHQFYNIFDSLNIQGFILKKGNNNFQLVSANM